MFTKSNRIESSLVSPAQARNKRKNKENRRTTRVRPRRRHRPQSSSLPLGQFTKATKMAHKYLKTALNISRLILLSNAIEAKERIIIPTQAEFWNILETERHAVFQRNSNEYPRGRKKRKTRNSHTRVVFIKRHTYIYRLLLRE